MMLLIDAGNSRIKWRLVGENVRASGACTHDAPNDLAVCLETPGITRVLGCNVAGPAKGEALAAIIARRGLALEWITSGAQRCDVHNMYAHPTRLGADRWAALIGARGYHRSRDVLVVMAGTATTLDILSADGRFIGGHILPGVELMRQALSQGTAQLPLMGGRYHSHPRDTADAIVSGCLNAQAGAIERVFRHMGAPGAVCLLSGGAADEIEPLLDIPFQRIDNLVLDGLHRIARAA
ncbi:MAG: type III pantothenate kinase [Proteobacteria bacterium]|jgi:type III pantothenate kinase|nr:type III pantothenate kinase [Pseudomonadota bacterium]